MQQEFPLLTENQMSFVSQFRAERATQNEANKETQRNGMEGSGSTMVNVINCFLL